MKHFDPDPVLKIHNGSVHNAPAATDGLPQKLKNKNVLSGRVEQGRVPLEECEFSQWMKKECKIHILCNMIQRNFHFARKSFLCKKEKMILNVPKS